jgi:hypothetical protein
VQQLHPVTHPGDSVAGAFAPAVPGSAVDDHDGQVGRLEDHGDAALLRPGVLDHVGDGLLDDAERGQVDLRRQRTPLAAPLDVHPDAGVPHVHHEPVDILEPGERLLAPT